MHFSVLCIIHDIISEIEFILTSCGGVLVMVLVLEKRGAGRGVLKGNGGELFEFQD